MISINKKTATREKKTTSREYPVIYSYIYEREAEDIKRLYDSFKKNRPKRRKVIIGKVITGFNIVNGKPVPIFREIT